MGTLEGHGLPPPQQLRPHEQLSSSRLWAIRGLWPVFLRSSVSSGTSRAPLPRALLRRSVHRAHRGRPRLGSCSRSACQSLKGAPWVALLRSSVRQASVGLAFLCSAADVGMWEERACGDGATPCVDCLASMAAWLSSTGISHHSLLPPTPLIHLSTVNSSPLHGIAPQSLNSSLLPLCLPGDLHPCPG